MMEADGVTLTIVVENSIDMLLKEEPDRGICRCGLVEHFDPALGKPVAENGICIQVAVHKGQRTFEYLFDFGLTPSTLRHNVEALRLDLSRVGHLVLSHGHPDHFGGITAALELIGRPVPVATHPDAFLPRYAMMGDGRVAGYYNEAFSEESVTRMGGRLILGGDAHEIGPGVLVSGEIPRHTAFEGPVLSDDLHQPGLYQVKDSRWRIDEVWDEQALIINVRDCGLVVLTGCGHAGVINTIDHAIALTGQSRLAVVMGGFHLGFPTTPSENITLTMDALLELNPALVVPSHCSGFDAMCAAKARMPHAFAQYAVGSQFQIGPRGRVGS